jgi:hypothetical protein
MADGPHAPGNPSGKAGSSEPAESGPPGPLKHLSARPNSGGCRNRARRFLNLSVVARDDFIAAQDSAAADMRAFANHDQVADLRIAIDSAEYPRFPFDPRISSDCGVLTVHLGHILNP